MRPPLLDPRGRAPLGALLSALWLTGCCSDRKSIDADPASRRVVTPAPSSSGPVVEVAPSATSSSEHSDQPAPLVVKTMPALHKVTTEAHEVVGELPPGIEYTPENNGPLTVYRLREVMLVLHGLEDGWTLSGQRLVPATGWEGLRRGARINDAWLQTGDWVRVVGRYPSDYWATVDAGFYQGPRMPTTTGRVSYHTVRGTSSRTPDLPLLAEPWVQGGVLTTNGQTLAYVGTAKVSLPVRTNGREGTARVRIEAMTTLPRGDVLVAGQDFDDPKHLALERWKPGETTSEVLPLPLHATRYVSVQATDSVTYVAAWGSDTERKDAAGLVRIEGTTITPLGLPDSVRFEDVQLTPDGTLWMLISSPDDGLYRLDAARGELQHYPLPRGVSSHGMFARDARVAYVGGDSPEATFLLSTDPEPIALESLPAAPASASASAMPWASASAPAASASAGSEPAPVPLRPDCATPFVILFAVGKTAPADYDYPATHDAMMGWDDAKKFRFVEFLRRDQRTLGARAPDVAAATALVERLRERIKGSSPAAVCFSPTRVVREVNLL